MKRTFKMIATVLTLIMALSCTVYASEPKETTNIGVGTEKPGDNTNPNIKGIDRPSSTWNVATKGQYDFSGSATGSTLYTNYKFTGATKYYVNVTNRRDGTLKVSYRNASFPYSLRGYCNIGASRTGAFYADAASTSSAIFLEFAAPSSFRGYIKKY